MSLENPHNQTSAENHLSLYHDIERQITPHSLALPQQTISDQFYKATKRPKWGWISFLVLLIALVSTGLILQFTPLVQLEAYRPTTLLAVGKKELIKQANALSDTINFDKCKIQGGVIVDEQLNYCVLDNKKYYEVIDIFEDTKPASIDTITPLNINQLNQYSVGKDSQYLYKGDRIYTGYITEFAPFLSQLVVRKFSSIDPLVAQLISSVSKGEQTITTELQQQFSPAQINLSTRTKLVSIDTTSTQESLYPGYSGLVSLIEYTENSVTTYHLVGIYTNSTYALYLDHTMSQAFSDSINKQVTELCSTVANIDDKLNCTLDKVLKDKSISEKIRKDSTDLLKRFAIAA
jgi:hypothetical protein